MMCKRLLPFIVAATVAIVGGGSIFACNRGKISEAAMWQTFLVLGLLVSGINAYRTRSQFK